MREPRLRNAVRALVLDPADRVLLVHFRFSHEDVWATPGGGVDEGESDIEALRRELHEETGYTEVQVGPPIWTRDHVFPLNERYDGQSETIYLVQADGPPTGPALLSEEQLRAEFVVGLTWWTLPELTATTELFTPRRLPYLVADLLRNGPPDTPIDAGR
jgi:8-oxo-dGTP pyrophosphatase MutT (NUDIX family)